jgi:hypothetical protein
MCAFYHLGKFIFLKFTLNYASFDVWHDWVQNFFQSLLGALPKGHDLSARQQRPQKLFSPVFGTFT